MSAARIVFIRTILKHVTRSTVALLVLFHVGPAFATDQHSASRLELNQHFVPELQSASLNGRVLAWAELGDPGGRSLVYAVGFPHLSLPAASVLSPFDAYLKRQKIRLIVFERTGASAVSTFDISDTLDTYVSDLNALLAHLDVGKFSLMGYSAGGPGALAVAASMPERIRSLHLVAARGRYTDELADRTGEAETSARLLDDPLANAPGLQVFPPARFLLPPDVADFYDRFFGADFIDSTLTQSFTAVPHSPEGISLSSAIGYQPWAFALQDVVVKTFVYQGLDDRVIQHQGYAQDTTARLGGEVIPRFYPGQNHFTTLTVHFDQLVADMHHLGRFVIMCGAANDRKRTSLVRSDRVKQALLRGATYGDCVWQ